MRPRCSTPEAISWDPRWATTSGDISGRAVDVHESADGFKIDKDAAIGGNGKSPVTARAGGIARTLRAQPLRATPPPRMPRFAGLRAAPRRVAACLHAAAAASAKRALA